MRGRWLLIGLVAALAAVVPAAAASPSSPQPFTVQSASVTQSAQNVVWRLTLTSSFHPADLKSAGRSLCLLIERKSGAVHGRLCVTGPRAGGASPRILYQKVTPAGAAGKATVIAATVTRSGSGSGTLTATFLPGAFSNRYQSIHWQVLNTLRPPACTPSDPHHAVCQTVFPARPALAKLHVPQLAGCTATGPAYVTNGPRSRHEIALTFDDGPWYDTPQFLDILERNNVPGTFFEIGEQISEYGEGGAIERRMLADGDMVGDHTWSHPNVSAGGAAARSQISRAAAAIKSATQGFQPCLFRAPYGAVSPALISLARSMGFTVIQWDVDPTDWARPGTDAIYDRVTSMARNGSIILQHDGGGNRSETLAALPREIQFFKARGYRFVTVTQLLGERLIYR